MHVRVRLFGKPDTIVVVESKLTKIEKFRRIIKDKFDVDPKLQRLLYGGKLLDDGYTFHDYKIKLNDVIQLMVLQEPPPLEKLKENADEKTKDKTSESKVANEVIYTDSESALHEVGDLVDMRDSEQGAWFEGKIVRIVQDPKAPTQAKVETSNGNRDTEQESDSENKPPSDATNSKNTSKPKKKGIAEYFSKTPKRKQDQNEIKQETACDKGTKDMHLLYKVQLDSDDENTCHYCKLRDIRPRARTVIEIKDLKIGQKVMVNHNTESPLEKGYWYDFKVEEIKKLRTSHDLIGTLYLGPEAVPQNDTKVRVHDKIFAIEEVVPLADRSPELKKLMAMQPDKRSLPLNCLTCRDDEDLPCKDCGCFLCSGKEFPDKIVLCDECNNGYHMICLTPPLLVLPEDDWYCPSCARDASKVVAPGAARQQRKTPAATSKRDWGRGMACVGKTKSCSMPRNHFGPIPGIEVGMCWRFRIQLSESGVHRPPVSGIHGRDVEGAYSIVLSGGYEDDVDHGEEFTYTGSGGRDLSGNKRTAEQSRDQALARENKALARNCAVKRVSEQGGDAGDAWREGRPVRVVRSYKMLKHFPKYAPREGIRYDGIYKVVKYYQERGRAGFRVWKYLLRRDDPTPPPWSPSSNRFPINYPDGFLEAEAQKRALKPKKVKGTKGKGVKGVRGVKGAKGAKVAKGAKGAKGAKVAKGAKGAKVTKGAKSLKGTKGTKGLKGVKGRKKRSLSDTSSSSSESASPPSKRRKQNEDPKESESETNNQSFDEANLQSTETKGLNDEEKQVILADVQNCKLWKECILVAETRGRKEFVEYVAQMFLCIICQEVAAGPVTTACAHNFCGTCLKLAFKSTGGAACPCCRRTPAAPAPNERLRAALRAVMPGYDSGRH